MIPRHSFHILTNRFSLVYKILFFTTITTLMFTAIVFSSLASIVEPITASITELQIFPHLLIAFRSMFANDPGAQAEAFEKLHFDWLELGNIFSSNESSIVIAIVVFIVIFIVYKVITDFTVLPASDILNSFMNSNSKYGFVSNCVANAGKSIKYSLVSNLFCLVYYLIAGLIIYGVAKLAFLISTFFGLAIVYLGIAFFLSLYRAITVYFVPTYINEKVSVFVAFTKAMKLGWKHLLPNLGIYFILNFVFMSLLPIIALSTFGIGLVVMLVVILVYNLVLDLVIYYRTTGLRYYTDSDVIVNPNTIVGNRFNI